MKSVNRTKKKMLTTNTHKKKMVIELLAKSGSFHIGDWRKS